MSIERLLRREFLSDAEWFAMLEDERKALIPHLDRLSLRTLGSLKLYHGRRVMPGTFIPSTNRLDEGRPRIKRKSNLGLATQGILMPGNWPKGEIDHPHDMKSIWGLTRDGRWLLAHVNYRIEYEGGRTNSCASAVPISIEIVQRSIEEIVTESGYGTGCFWFWLIEAVRRIHEERQRHQQRFDSYMRDVEIERRLFREMGYPQRGYKNPDDY